MTLLLALLTGFGYILCAVFVGALVAFWQADRVVSLLDSTIDWPADDTADLDAAHDTVISERITVDLGRDALFELLSASPLYVPAWENTPGTSLAIIQAHPLGQTVGFDAAFARWRAVQ